MRVIEFARRCERRRAELQLSDDWVCDMWYLWLTHHPAHKFVVRANYMDLADFSRLCRMSEAGVTAVTYRIGVLERVYYMWNKRVEPWSARRASMLVAAMKKMSPEETTTSTTVGHGSQE